MSSVIGQGAEAILTKIDDKVVKTRPKKSYRLPFIDTKLRKLRTRHEARLLDKLNEIGVSAPLLLDVDEKDMVLKMSFIQGKKLRDVLDSSPELAMEVGRIVGRLHKNDIIHADLTTSNFIVNDALNIIDFGLSFISLKIEDKAVDLHVLDRAFESRHHSVYPEVFEFAVKGYKETNPNADEVLVQLEKVQSRGRNKKKSGD